MKKTLALIFAFGMLLQFAGLHAAAASSIRTVRATRSVREVRSGRTFGVGSGMKRTNRVQSTASTLRADSFFASPKRHGGRETTADRLQNRRKARALRSSTHRTSGIGLRHIRSRRNLHVR